MANPRIPYRLSTRRPKLTPPEAGRIMVHLVVNVENWRFDQAMPRSIITPPHGKETIPDVPNFSWADYGMRAGLPRILDAIVQRGLPASTSFNASVIDAYPAAAEAMLEAGWEFIGHGLHQKSLNFGEDEADNIFQSLEKIQSFTGVRPRGWLSPGLRETFDTPELLVEAGVEYVCDWVVDDLPNWMRVKRGSLMQMPYNLELNDSIIYAIEKHSSDEFLLRLQRTLSLFERESEEQPRVLALGLHPHLIGVPHRYGYFEEMLDLLLRSQHVCFMTGGQIADWYRAQEPAPEPDA
ncbi:polysaccharide deacetylase family protein [Parapusillimonas granuli]|uniref:Polysaccharide deacetylase family protein n=1 Tax=Parapusillimonas granuli TaxID=380911 RepID=A0A853G3F6_9BURK|nr:polysaccharide deacetylase family protein [Parapusillimonas granuli]MBB5214939.1 peptidoglycan/xylan/chitin deacetylase (PgdA/CDA1 family) [Parapusillimonas granuli]MEB2401202.1 polysaccharide deacetylase family protein [Alcaligenaceae bacterium]NYT49261.1 polysaccharide deacetylase family protein [Parapusillimonas granuli]